MILSREKIRATGDFTLDSSDRKDWIAAFVLFFLAFLFRLVRLFDVDLNFDEVVLLFQIDKSFAEIWNFCKIDNYPPLYPWLLKLWGLVSRDDRWFRLFAALMGALAAPAAYFLGREVLDRKVGWILGGCVAASASLIFYSHFVRMFNIQPFFVCLSLLFFIKALRTNRWTYWILTGLSNLFGFYVYVLMIFIFTAELMILIIANRADLKSYKRFFLANLPFFIGLFAWVIPLLQRYSQLQGGFWIPPFYAGDFVKVWVFLGTGNDFRDRYLLAFFLNLPFFIGMIFGIKASFKNERLKIVAQVFWMVVGIFIIISLIGQSFFAKPYFLFILPLYLAVVIAGWMQLKKILWRKIGLILVTVIMGISLLYYYADFYKMKEFWGYVRPWPEAQKSEGHFFKTMVDQVAEIIQDGEVIIHYSNQNARFRSFFPSVYYHQRTFPEYLYSKAEITQYNGLQYLQPGEWIKSLDDLPKLPQGIWLFTLDDPVLFFDHSQLEGARSNVWLLQENLPEEIIKAGYALKEMTQLGMISLIYFQRITSQNSNTGKIGK